MERFVGQQTVVMLLCGFEKKYEGNNGKKSQISADSGNLEQWHFQVCFCFIFFFYGRITLSIGSTGLPTEHKNA